MIRPSNQNGLERELSVCSDPGSPPARVTFGPGSRAPQPSGVGHQTLNRPHVVAAREPPVQMDFDACSLRFLRRFVARCAAGLGMSSHRGEDLVLAVDELATNSIAYGGGGGTLLVWRAGEQIVCEVRDGGHIEDPLVGLRLPAPEQLTGRGLWIVRRLCDSVRVDSLPGRTAVRIHMSLG